MQPSNKCWALQILFQNQLLYTSVCKYQLKLIYALSASRLSVPGFLNTHIISPLNAELSEDKQDAKLLWLLTEGKRWRNSRKSDHSTSKPKEGGTIHSFTRNLLFSSPWRETVYLFINISNFQKSNTILIKDQTPQPYTKNPKQTQTKTPWQKLLRQEAINFRNLVPVWTSAVRAPWLFFLVILGSIWLLWFLYLKNVVEMVSWD